MSPHQLLLARIRGEYQEMPGLRLTFAQASRLWHMDATTTERVLHSLVEQKFLVRTKDGAFVAARGSDVHRGPVAATLASARSVRPRLRRPA